MINSISESCLVESIYGRAEDGVRSTEIAQAKDTTTITTPATASWPKRTRHGRAAPSRYTAAKAGNTKYAAIILMLNPNPTQTAHASSQPQLPFSLARNSSQVASNVVITNKLSMMLSRLVTTEIGEMASATAESNAANAPNARRTMR